MGLLHYIGPARLRQAALMASPSQIHSHQQYVQTHAITCKCFENGHLCRRQLTEITKSAYLDNNLVGAGFWEQ